MVMTVGLQQIVNRVANVQCLGPVAKQLEWSAGVRHRNAERGREVPNRERFAKRVASFRGWYAGPLRR